ASSGGRLGSQCTAQKGWFGFITRKNAICSTTDTTIMIGMPAHRSHHRLRNRVEFAVGERRKVSPLPRCASLPPPDSRVLMSVREGYLRQRVQQLLISGG